MKQFYCDILGFEPTHYTNEDDKGWLVFNLRDDLPLVISNTSESLKRNPGWAKQPSFSEGTLFAPSWTMRCESENEFRKVIAEVQGAGFPVFTQLPIWKLSYWTFICQDPAGNTVDVYYEPEEMPEGTPVWVD